MKDLNLRQKHWCVKDASISCYLNPPKAADRLSRKEPVVKWRVRVPFKCRPNAKLHTFEKGGYPNEVTARLHALKLKKLLEAYGQKGWKQFMDNACQQVQEIATGPGTEAQEDERKQGHLEEEPQHRKLCLSISATCASSMGEVCTPKTTGEILGAHSTSPAQTAQAKLKSVTTDANVLNSAWTDATAPPYVKTHTLSSACGNIDSSYIDRSGGDLQWSNSPLKTKVVLVRSLKELLLKVKFSEWMNRFQPKVTKYNVKHQFHGYRAIEPWKMSGMSFGSPFRSLYSTADSVIARTWRCNTLIQVPVKDSFLHAVLANLAARGWMQSVTIDCLKSSVISWIDGAREDFYEVVVFAEALMKKAVADDFRAPVIDNLPLVQPTEPRSVLPYPFVQTEINRLMFLLQRSSTSTKCRDAFHSYGSQLIDKYVRFLKSSSQYPVFVPFFRSALLQLYSIHVIDSDTPSTLDSENIPTWRVRSMLVSRDRCDKHCHWRYYATADIFECFAQDCVQ